MHQLADLISMIRFEMEHPFGFLLYLDPTDDWEYKGVDITHWADVGYDDIRDIVLPWKIYEMNDLFPEHYRTKEEIRECMRLF